MQTFTVESLISRVRTRADMRGNEDNTPVSDLEVLDYLNDALMEMVDLATTGDSNYFRTSSSLTTDGTAYLNLPSDFWKLKLLETGGRQIFPFHLQSKPLIADLHYRLIGDQTGQEKLEYYPIPSAGMALNLHYIPEYQPLD